MQVLPVLWLIAFLTDIATSSSDSIASKQLVLDPSRLCKRTRRLKGKQSFICKNEPDVVNEIRKGAYMGSKECALQFSKRRWNCTSVRKSMKKVLERDTREAAFVHAITTAGVTYAVAQACSLGLLLECSCQIQSRNRNSHKWSSSELDWRGCSDNVDFGYKKSKEFMSDHQLRRKRGDIKSLVLKHNQEAGRLAVKLNMRTVCKCHGMSGSCSLKTCWRKLPIFRDVGNVLKEKFDGASKVIPDNNGIGFIPEGEIGIMKIPSKQDIVYSEESPNFCTPDHETGSLGTSGRECNATSPGVDGCDLLCCGRGFVTTTIVDRINCNCRFKWCCDVICDTCNIEKQVHRCL